MSAPPPRPTTRSATAPTTPFASPGAEVRAKVIGEGANLGVTQRGRIEAARAGVRLNTDAIDNSAGVNTSDVEVNIKIALAVPERDGRLTPEARNALLAEMTDEVGRARAAQQLPADAGALAVRAARPRRISASRAGSCRRWRRGPARPRGRVSARRRSARRARAARRGADAARARRAARLCQARAARRPARQPRAGRSLSRHASWCAISRPRMRERFPDAIDERTGCAARSSPRSSPTRIVNRGGPTVVTRLADQTGADAPTIAAAYAAVRDSYGLIELNGAIDALDGMIPGALQLRLYGQLQDLLLSPHGLVHPQRRLDAGPWTPSWAASARASPRSSAALEPCRPGGGGAQAARTAISWGRHAGGSGPAPRRAAGLWPRPTSCWRRRRPGSRCRGRREPISRSRRSGSADDRRGARTFRSPTTYDRLALDRALDGSRGPSRA